MPGYEGMPQIKNYDYIRVWDLERMMSYKERGLIFILTLGIGLTILLSSVESVLALEPGKEKGLKPLKLWEEHQIILDGKVTVVKEKKGKFEHHVQVTHFFKTPFKFNPIIAYSDKPLERFDRYLLFLYDTGKNYQISSYSTKITPDCKVKDKILLLAVPNLTLENNKQNSRYLSSQPCLPPNYVIMNHEIVEIPGKPDKPLQQKKKGVSNEEVTCQNDLKLVVKLSKNMPACVMEKSIQKLQERGWAANNFL